MGVPLIKNPYFEPNPVPNYEGDNLFLEPDKPKKNRLTFKYYKKTEHFPANIPDKVLNPGTWVYYDVDLDAVKEQLAKDYYFSGRMDPEEFKQR
jgi:hypothetical protein